MNITTLITNIRNAVHDNSALSAWCTTNYGRAHKVYIGVDTRKPPDNSAYPLVHVFPMTKSAGGGNQDLIVGLTCGIYDADTRTVTGYTRVVEFEGVQNIEAFRKLVETAALTAVLDNGYWFADLDIVYETVEFFPFFLAGMQLTVRGDIAFPSDQFA